MFNSQISKIVIGTIQIIAISPFLPVVALAHICAMVVPNSDEDQSPRKVGKTQLPRDSFSIENSQMISDSFLVA